MDARSPLLFEFIYFAVLSLAPFIFFYFILNNNKTKIAHLASPEGSARVELPTAFPWRCKKPHRKRYIRHYYLRMRTWRRRSQWPSKPPNKHQARKAWKAHSGSPPPHWQHYPSADQADDFDRGKHGVLHQSAVMFDLQFGISLHDFVATLDPLAEIQALKAVSRPTFLMGEAERATYDSSIDQALIAALQLRPSESGDYVPPNWNEDSTDPTRLQREQVSVYFNPTADPSPIVIDTGASLSLTPHLNDFVGPLTAPKIRNLNGLSGQTSVKGVGTVEWTVIDVFGVKNTIRTVAYYVPDARIRLFSPQTYFQEQRGGRLVAAARRITLELADGSSLEFPYQGGSNLPLMLPSEPLTAGLTYSDCDFMSKPTLLPAFMTTVHHTNQNLSANERELLLWHQRLGHANFRWIQRLFAKRPSDDGSSSSILSSSNPRVSSCHVPLCAACQLSKQTRRTPDRGVVRTQAPDHVLRQGHLKPGDKVSCDQYISALPGRLRTGFGKVNDKRSMYNGGTIFVDHATQFIFIRNQVSLRAGETVQAKRAFEQLAATFGNKISSYRADNMPFNSADFQNSIATNNQTIDFAGVGAHHQNGVAERAIQTVTQWARALLLHAVISWPDSADLSLWPFAFEHAVYLWNHLPRHDSLLSPAELFSATKDSNNRLQRSHVWGCPVYVLDPKLQDGKKLPKWNPRSRRGQFLGQSPSHSSTIGLILNGRTGFVSPQYHVIYDDEFTTVPNAERGGLLNLDTFDQNSWNRLVASGLERHLDALDRDASGNRVLPELHDDWLTSLERRTRAFRRARQTNRATGPARLLRAQQHPGRPTNPEGEGNRPPIIIEPLPEVEFDAQQDAEQEAPMDDDMRSLPEGDGNLPPAEDLPDTNEPEQAPPQQPTEDDGTRTQSGRRVRPNPKYVGQNWTNFAGYSGSHKIKMEALNNQFLAMLDWNKAISMFDSPQFAQIWALTEYDESGTLVEWMHPMVLAAKANSEDSPNWDAAMNGPLADGYWKASEKEIKTLNDMNAWDVIPRPEDVNVLPGTWAFKCKRFPSGDVRKLKARFCVRGDKQIQDIDYFETFAPVVNWNTVRLLLILSIVMGLQTKQVDYTAAFVHAPLDEDVYVEMPRGFVEPGCVLKLKRSLYGLKQSPRNFFQHLKGKLERAGFRNKEEVDPCLFVSDKCICLVYVDDTLFFSPKQSHIDEAIDKLKKDEMDLEIEDSVAGFLGVHIERNDDDQTIKLTQSGLAKRVIDALGDAVKSAPIKQTPSTSIPLIQDENGDPPNGLYNYASVIGMLQYLQGHSRPDITYAVSSAARFVHSPRRSHEIGLERIGQYLKGTVNEGLIMRPSGRFDIDCYVDSDFAGLWPYEDKLDPESVKSRTGFVICISGCPVVWISKMQQMIATSTMEAEYNALSTAMRDVIPLQELFRQLGNSIGIDDEIITTFNTVVHEDNQGAMTLAKMEPGRHTPRSKHYGVKVHWFRSKLKPNRVTVERIDTQRQLADILTKGLKVSQFRKIRHLLCGW